MADQQVTLQTSAGPMRCVLSLPEGSARVPGVVVVPEAFGVNGAIQEACRRLSQAGFAALAPEIYHRTAPPGFVAPYDFAAVEGHFGPMTNGGLAEDVRVARDHLAGHARVGGGPVGVVGFCVGGFTAYLAACEVDLACAVPFYGGGIARGRPQFKMQPLLGGTPRCPTLCFFGGNDPSIPAADVEAVRARLAQCGPQHEVVVYPAAGHAFANAERSDKFHPEAAADAWARTLSFLGRHLRGA